MSTSNDSTPSYRCSTCGVEKPLTDEFWHKDKTSRTGYAYKCKTCALDRSRRWVAENRQRNKDNCNKWYAEHQDRVHVYRAENADHDKAYKRAWRKAHPNLVKQHKSASQKRHRDSANVRARRYGHNHPERVKVFTQKRQARKRSLPDTFTPTDWEHCLAYFHDCCAVCGKPQGLWHKLAMDHWIPLSDPVCPGTVVTNIVPLCHGEGGCNNSKCDRDPLEWLRDKFGPRRAAVIQRAIEAYFESVQS